MALSTDGASSPGRTSSGMESASSFSAHQTMGVAASDSQAEDDAPSGCGGDALYLVELERLLDLVIRCSVKESAVAFGLCVCGCVLCGKSASVPGSLLGGEDGLASASPLAASTADGSSAEAVPLEGADGTPAGGGVRSSSPVLFLANGELSEDCWDVLREAAHKGVCSFPWLFTKVALAAKVQSVFESLARRQARQLRSFDWKRARDVTLAALLSFEAPPLTLQRLCELALRPEPQQLEKLYFAFRKLLRVRDVGSDSSPDLALSPCAAATLAEKVSMARERAAQIVSASRRLPGVRSGSFSLQPCGLFGCGVRTAAAPAGPAAASAGSCCACTGCADWLGEILTEAAAQRVEGLVGLPSTTSAASGGSSQDTPSKTRTASPLADSRQQRGGVSAGADAQLETHSQAPPEADSSCAPPAKRKAETETEASLPGEAVATKGASATASGASVKKSFCQTKAALTQVEASPPRESAAPVVESVEALSA